MLEGDLNRKLVSALRAELKGSVVLKIADHITSGIPDISVDWMESHVWIETKLAKPSFQSRGLQEDTMQKLVKQGEAWYVIYEANPQSVYICSPVIIRDGWVKDRVWQTNFQRHFDNWNHQAVARFFGDVLQEKYYPSATSTLSRSNY